MAPDVNEIHIEEEGFITTKKGFTLSSMSLFIWILTGILFKISMVFFSQIDYQTFCFFVSLLLSGMAGLYLTGRLVKNVSGSSRMLLAVANILLLYTSANGIQSGYCFLSDESINDGVKHSALIPFIEAKPWLPDKFQSNKIERLEVQNEVLEQKVAELEFYTADKSELMKEIEKLKSNNRSLSDSLNILQKESEQTADYLQIKEELRSLRADKIKLEETIAQLRERLNETSDYSEIKKTAEELTKENQRLSADNKDLQTKLAQASGRIKELETQNRTLNSNISDCEARLSRFIERIKDFNSLQAAWRTKVQQDQEFRSSSKSITRFMGNDFYKRFFDTPISLD
jgi:regulator of replication initiation timing